MVTDEEQGRKEEEPVSTEIYDKMVNRTLR
jgi:hypothetical protein